MYWGYGNLIKYLWRKASQKGTTSLSPEKSAKGKLYQWPWLSLGRNKEHYKQVNVINESHVRSQDFEKPPNRLFSQFIYVSMGPAKVVKKKNPGSRRLRIQLRITGGVLSLSAERLLSWIDNFMKARWDIWWCDSLGDLIHFWMYEGLFCGVGSAGEVRVLR